VEVVSGLCQELARTLAESELRLAKDALSKAKARLVELEKKQAELEPRKKELEEEYKFRWPHEGGSGNPFPGDKGFTGPLHDKLAKLQELQFGNDLRSASVQAQLDYVRTTLAKESQVVDVFRPGSATGAVVPGINPVWSSLKQRLVELETESIGLKATGDRLKQMLAETQGALDDAAEYLSLKSTLLPNLRNQSTKEKAQLESLEAIVARIEREGPLPVPYVVESTRPQPELPAGAGMPTAPGMPTGPGMGPGGPGPTPKH
jgi:uncharacterized coiled-coil protein SlyX